jgi:ketosteroid isomerase-like protein
MYHAIVRAKVRATWRRIATGDYGAAVGLAAPDLRFQFLGPAPLGGQRVGAAAFEAWFADLFRLLPGLRLTLRDVSVGGPPWNTVVSARIDASATLSDGTPYRNQGLQWARLRWGRMVEDVVIEDTALLVDALRRQGATDARG